MRLRLGVFLAVFATWVALVPARGAAPCNWPKYGHDQALSFSQTPACSKMSRVNAALMAPKWYFHGKDSMSASTTVVDGVLYIGAWDGTMHALDAATGKKLWTFNVDDRHQIGFGRIVSTAAVDTVNVPGAGPVKVLLFGGGGTLYALAPGRAGARLLAKVDVDPRDAALRAQATREPEIEIESSPLVGHFASGDRIYVGFDVHNNAHVGRAGMLSFTLSKATSGALPYRFDLAFKFDPERQVVLHSLTDGSGTGWGCGDVWSSPALRQTSSTAALLVFGTGNCDHPDQSAAAGEVGREGMFAIDALTGAMRWQFHPRGVQDVDDDFGASPNILDGGGAIGEGGKDGWYYKLNAETGRLIWAAHGGQAGHLQTGFAVGGFIGTTAVGWAGKRPAVFGAVAISTPIKNTIDQPLKTQLDTSLARDPGRLLSLVAMDEQTGKVLWHGPAVPSYGAVTYSNGVVLIGDTVSFSLDAYDAKTGLPLAVRPVPGPPSAAPVIVGNMVYLALGTSETDLEFKAFGHGLENLFNGTIGESPLSPLSGVIAFSLPR